VQDEKDVEKLFEDFKIRNGADRLLTLIKGKKVIFLLSFTTPVGLLLPLRVYLKRKNQEF
jgi:hypothetical protein